VHAFLREIAKYQKCPAKGTLYQRVKLYCTLAKFMRKTIEYLGILQIGVNYMFQKQSVGNRHDGSTIQPGILLRTLGRSGEEEY